MNTFIEALILFIVAAKKVDSKISLDINVGINDNDVTITHSGFGVDVIGHREIELFNIGNANIRKAVMRHYHWSPSNVYLKSLTPWGDLFWKYNWEQVSRVLTVKSAGLKTITKKPVVGDAPYKMSRLSHINRLWIASKKASYRAIIFS